MADAVFQAIKTAPVTEMVATFLPEFLMRVNNKTPWEEILPLIREQRHANWVAIDKTPTLGRPVTSLEHPKLMNPYQTLIDVMLTALTGKL